MGFILTGGEASDYATADVLITLPLPKPSSRLWLKSFVNTA